MIWNQASLPAQAFVLLEKGDRITSLRQHRSRAQSGRTCSENGNGKFPASPYRRRARAVWEAGRIRLKAWHDAKFFGALNDGGLDFGDSDGAIKELSGAG